MVREHEALRSRYDKLATVHNRACALLQEKYQMGQDAEEDMRRRGAVTDLIGEGSTHSSLWTTQLYPQLSMDYSALPTHSSL
jgi:hypothetical protein